MRKFIVILGIVFIMLVGSVNASINDDVFIYHTFDNDYTNTTTSLASIGDYNAERIGTTSGVVGKISEAYSYSQTPDYLEFGTNLGNALGNTDITISTWFKSDSYANDRWLFYFGNFNGWGMWSLAQKGTSSWGLCRSNNCVNFNIIPDTIDYIHFAVTFNDTNYAIWYNGTKVIDVNVSTNYNYAGQNFILGAGYNPSTWSGIIGDIDEFAIYNRKLSDDEILDIYNNGNAQRPVIVSIDSVSYKDTTGSNIFYQDEYMDYFNVNISIGASNKSTEVLLYLTDGNDNVVLNNVSLSNTSGTEYNYSTNILLDNIGIWNYTIYLNTDETNATETGNFTVNEVEMSLATSLYGWDYEGIPTNDTITTDAATYYFDYIEITFDSSDNWKTILERINATKSVNKKVILTMYDNMNGSNHTVEYINTHFSDLITSPYLNWVYAIFIKVGI